MRFDTYQPEDFYDKLFVAPGQPRPEAQSLIDRVNSLPAGELQQRRQAACQALLKLGATFNVYGDAEGTERIMPFDIIPRIVAEQEWRRLEQGLKQRIQALNLFIGVVVGVRCRKLSVRGLKPILLNEWKASFPSGICPTVLT